MAVRSSVLVVADTLVDLAGVDVSAPIVLCLETGKFRIKGANTWGDIGVGAAGPTGPSTYAIAVQALTSSPVDGQTIFFGTLPRAPAIMAATSRILIRRSGAIKIAEIYCFSGTAGSAEAWPLSIRKNNTTDTLVATVSAATQERVFNNSALNIPVVAGDFIEIKAVNPTWSVNPLTTVFGGYLVIDG